MKTTTINKFICTTLMLAAFVSCGKDNKSSSSAGTAVNPIYGNQLGATGAQAYTNAKAWYASRTEPASSLGQKQEERMVQLVANQNNCKNNSYLGGFINIQTCFSGNSNSNPPVVRPVNVIASPVKSSNPKLVPVFSAGLTLINASQTTGAFGLPVYTLEFGKANGHVIRYKIDTGLNSAFNPVEIWDTEQGRLEYVSNPQQLRY